MFDKDTQILSLQIGRELRAKSRVVARCNAHLPIVAEVPPMLETGEPFPTRYWLTCPLAQLRVARLEASGGVRDAQSRIDNDPEFAAALTQAHIRYATERNAHIPNGARWVPQGGIGGSRGGVKCLHAHFADFMARNDNPIGQSVYEQVGEPQCSIPCIALVGKEPRRNPAWREPMQHMKPSVDSGSTQPLDVPRLNHGK